MKKEASFFLLWLIAAPLTLLAQERQDTLVAGVGLTASDLEELTRPLTPGEGVQPSADVAPVPRQEGLWSSKATDIPLSPVLTSPYQAPLFIHVAPERPFFPRWDTGYLTGYSTQYGDWLRGYQAVAGVGLYQQLGDNWTFTASASLYKNSIYYNSASFDGRLSWRPNRHFGMTAFGSYSPGAFLSPVALGQSFNWGGFVTLERGYFGIDLGAQMYYDPMMGHDVEPIVMPYVKLGEAKLGIDVGPMLKNALQKDRHDGPGFNPIPQPIKAVPQIAPRR